jgi:hypothetical protein
MSSTGCSANSRSFSCSVPREEHNRLSRPQCCCPRLTRPPARGPETIEISAEIMTLVVDGDVSATARFSQRAAAGATVHSAGRSGKVWAGFRKRY